MQFNPDLLRIQSSTGQSQGLAGSSNASKAGDVLQDKLGRGVAQATGVAKSAVSATDKKTPEDVAKTMLDHVARGLDSLRRQGADEGRLQERMDAARAGIEKGYKEATQQLKDMGMLDESLQADIDKGKGLIAQGLDQMQQNLSSPDAVQQGSFSSFTQVENSLSLEVMTRDGDRVQVSFQQTASNGYAASYGENSSVTASSYSEGFEWQMDVNGALDEEEQQALSSLLSDVEKLSSSFFKGDLGGALEQAMSLGFDGNELASLSLNLTQSSFSSVSQAYNAVQPQLPTEQLEGLKAPLLAYNEDYFNALEKASTFADPNKLIDDLVDQLLPDEKLKGIFQAYNQGLQNAVDLKNSLLS